MTQLSFHVERKLTLTTYLHHYTHIINKIERNGKRGEGRGLGGAFGKFCVPLEKSRLRLCFETSYVKIAIRTSQFTKPQFVSKGETVLKSFTKSQKNDK